MPCRSKKRCRVCGRNIAPDPMVDAGNPPYCHETRSAPHPTRQCHRLVALATRTPGRSTSRPSQKKQATVMLSGPPSSSNTVAKGINNASQIVGTYSSGSGGTGATLGFLYNGGVYTTLNDPLGTTTD